MSVRGKVEVKGEGMIVADYSEFPIRDQDVETRQTLDLLQGWRSVGPGSFRLRLGRALVRVGNALLGWRPVRKATLTPPSHCEQR